jgi:hypothetical protein
VLRLRAVLVAMLVIALATASSLPAPVNLATTSYLAEVFERGETLQFALSWLRMTGGRARMIVQPLANGSIKIESIAESNALFAKIYPVRDQIESIVTRETFSTLRFEKTLNERKRRKNELTVVDPQRGVALRKGKEIPVPDPVFDPLSTIYYLRTLDLTPGKKHYFTILADGKVYTLQADVLYRETIEAPAGKFKTVVVEPKMRHGGIFRDENNRLVIWFSDDQRRIPVRIRSYLSVGTITASLQSSELGSSSSNNSRF